MKKPSTMQKIRAQRLSFLVLSLGWDGALAYVKTLTPEQKAHYFDTKENAR